MFQTTNQICLYGILFGWIKKKSQLKLKVLGVGPHFQTLSAGHAEQRCEAVPPT